MNPSIVKAVELTRKARKIVITSHVNPDGDAIGSCLALYHAMIACGKEAEVNLPSVCPKNLSWLPAAAKIRVFDAIEDLNKPILTDLVFVLDLNDLSRLKELGHSISSAGVPIVNIDHHTFPKDFATVQWIDTNASATCEMLFEFINFLLRESNTTPNTEARKHIATCLYVGIMTDTGSFRFPRTTSGLHRVVAQLIDEGADPVQAYELIMNTSSPARTRLLGQTISTMELVENGQLCTMTVTAVQLRESGCTMEDLEGFVHHTTASQGVMIGILFVETADEIKCSLRSKGELNIRNVAAKYGGGGHQHASGVRISSKSLSKVKLNLTEDCIKVLRGEAP